MYLPSSPPIAVIFALTLVAGAVVFLQLSVPTGASASSPAPSKATRSASFEEGTVTVKVSGSVGGIEVGPFTNLHFAEESKERTLTVHLDQATSEGGGRLARVPIYLYRSLRGPIRAGDQIVAFSQPPLRQAEEVAADRARGTLVWTVEPGDYFLFFAWTRPIVRVAPEDRPAEVVYTVTVE